MAARAFCALTAQFRGILHMVVWEVIVMKTFLITFRSITFAQRAEAALQRHGIRSTIRRTPKWMEERGCGYAVELKQGDVAPVTGILDSQGIAYRRIYRVSEDGTIEEGGR